MIKKNKLSSPSRPRRVVYVCQCHQHRPRAYTRSAIQTKQQPTLHLWLCPVQQLKQQLRCTHAAMQCRGPHCRCSGGGPQPPRSFRVGAHGRATHSFPPLSLISHLTSVDVKQYVCLLTYDAWRTEFEQNVLWCLSGRWERLRHDISLWGKVNWENRITGFSVERTLRAGALALVAVNFNAITFCVQRNVKGKNNDF